MKFVLLIGDAAVGKMTVGQHLEKITKLKLFHNHMTIEPVIEIFGKYNATVIRKWRNVVFEEYSKTDNYETIFNLFISIIMHIWNICIRTNIRTC